MKVYRSSLYSLYDFIVSLKSFQNKKVLKNMSKIELLISAQTCYFHSQPILENGSSASPLAEAKALGVIPDSFTHILIYAQTLLDTTLIYFQNPPFSPPPCSRTSLNTSSCRGAPTGLPASTLGPFGPFSTRNLKGFSGNIRLIMSPFCSELSCLRVACKDPQARSLLILSPYLQPLSPHSLSTVTLATAA